MDEARIKKLAWMVGISVVVILLLKAVLLNTATKVGEAREKRLTEKHRLAAPVPAAQLAPADFPEPPPSPTAPADSMLNDPSAASGVE